MYSERLLEHFQNPRNSGQIENPDVIVTQENPVCGDVLELSICTLHGHIAQIRFRAKGCVPAVACGSAITELAQDRTLAEISNLTREELIEYVGGLPAASSHAAQLAIDALHQAVEQISSNRA
jgi:nitrogen fixation protein NifU and related proteins